ncbi:MAG: HlyD family secretion protein [Candidatus Heimdallarchaeota archaeon]
MRSKSLGFRIHILQTLVNDGFYEFATGFFDETRVKVCASGSQLRLIRVAALMARGVAERGGVCLVVLPSLTSEAAIYLRGMFDEFNLSQADWEYKTTQTIPPNAMVIFTSQKTLRKVVLKKGRVHLPFDTLIFLGLETTLFSEEWADSNLVVIRLKEMGILQRIPHYFLVEKHVNDLVGWLESLELKVTTNLDEAYLLSENALKATPKEVGQFFQMAFRAGKHNFVFRLTRKWRSKKTLLRAVRWSSPYFMATGGQRMWLEREALRLLELGLKLRLVYRRSYKYRYEPKKEARVVREVVAPEAGQVVKILVNEGEFVERGQEILVIKTKIREFRLKLRVSDESRGFIVLKALKSGQRVP